MGCGVEKVSLHSAPSIYDGRLTGVHGVSMECNIESVAETGMELPAVIVLL